MGAQFAFGGVLATAAETGPLLNPTVPLPELNTARLEKFLKPAKTKTLSTSTPAPAAVSIKKDAAGPTAADASITPTAVAAQTPSTIADPAIKVLGATEPLLTEPSWGTDSAAPKTSLKSAFTSKSILKPAATTTSDILSTQKPGTSGWVEDALAERVTPTTPNATNVELRAPLAASTPTEKITEAPTTAAPDTVTAPAATASAPVQTAEQPEVAETIEEAAAQADPVAVAALPSSAPLTGTATFEHAPIFIDNDELAEQEETLVLEEMPMDESGTKIKAGARFPITITAQLSSKTAKVGDIVHGRLKYDLKIGDRLVAAKGSSVRGHVNYALKARTVLGSIVSTNRFYRNSGCLGLQFDEILNEKGEHIPLAAEPSKQSRMVKNKYEGRELGINHKGQIVGPWSTQLRYKAIRVGLNFAMAPVGAMSFGAMPVALGVLGAANPSFAFGKPVGYNVRHRRVKGFAWGFLSGVPGSFLIEDTTVKGQESIIKPGDEFYAEIRQEFTGEPASEADLAGADAKVKGEIVEMQGNKKKKK